MRHPARASGSLALLLLASCGAAPHIDDASVADATVLAPDAPSTADLPDALALDSSASSDAASIPDAGFDPLLAITGSCGVLDDELTDAQPHWVANTSTFPDGWTLAEAARLSTGAQSILAEGTAGGSSGYSEAFAFEVLHRCEGASLVASETLIRYTVPMPGSITDILVEIDGMRIGVSVTRAVTVTGMCTRADGYDLAVATDLLTRKLAGINESSMLVVPELAWTKQILFVYADTEAHASVLMSAWAALDETLRADTVLYVSVSEAMDGFVYFEDRCG